MQIYKIPYNFAHEERVFGGYISIRQAIYLLIAASSAGIFFIPVIDVFLKSIIFVIIASMFIIFTFVKIEDTNSDKYFIYVVKFLCRKKKFILEKKGNELC